MVGAGTNYKSMAYVGNIVEFIKFSLSNVKPGYDVYNYVDKPDLNMNQLVLKLKRALAKNPISSFPLSFGYAWWLLL
jgi:nucleoside-diphosphate-sugar epimerase